MLNQDISTGYKRELTLADLREIVEATNEWDEQLQVTLHVSQGDRPFDSDTYKISVRNG